MFASCVDRFDISPQLTLVQVLVSAGDAKTWTRWGRVGERGLNKILGMGSLDDAKAQFKKKFKEKTGLVWESRMDEPRPNKYVFLEKSYQPDSESEEDSKPAAGNGEAKKGPPPCTLEPAVQDLMKLIFNERYFAAAMTDMNYDLDKLPLGKLSKATIMRGFQTLKDLSLVLDDPAAAAAAGNTMSVEDYSNRFYSLIPHNFGRNRPPIINNQVTVKREIELLETLADMKDASEILKAELDERNNLHPLDRQYLGLGMKEMTELDRNGTEFNLLKEYLINTRGQTHGVTYQNVESIFRIERQGEKDRFISDTVSDRRLLWHGSRATNFGGILSQGLRIAPPEAPATGYMFDKGIYLADMSSKSVNYCYSYISDNTALLLLCEAELGKPMQEFTDFQYNAAALAKKKGVLSTFGKGSTGPLVWKDAECVHPSLKGIKMPDTSSKLPGSTGVVGGGLLYNEYITYDVSQVRLRYLFRVKM
jgi:poly [ADP-ribose] polymerase 2/3/4